MVAPAPVPPDPFNEIRKQVIAFAIRRRCRPDTAEDVAGYVIEQLLRRYPSLPYAQLLALAFAIAGNVMATAARKPEIQRKQPQLDAVTDPAEFSDPATPVDRQELLMKLQALAERSFSSDDAALVKMYWRALAAGGRARAKGTEHSLPQYFRNHGVPADQTAAMIEHARKLSNQVVKALLPDLQLDT